MKKVILGIFLGLLILLSSCIVTQQGKFSIDNIEEGIDSVKVDFSVQNTDYDEVILSIQKDGKEFDKVVVKNNINTYTFDGLLANTSYQVILSGIYLDESKLDSVIVKEFTTLNNQMSGIIFDNEVVSYTGDVIIPTIEQVPSDATVTFYPTDIIDAGEYSVTATISKPNFDDVILTKTLIVEKINYPEYVIYNYTLEATYTGSPITFYYETYEGIESEVAYYKNGNIVNQITECGNYEVVVTLYESKNFLETKFTFNYKIVEKELTVFISEYLEGYYDEYFNPTGNNNDKAIELYNPTTEEINLVGYNIKIYPAGLTTPKYIINLTGTILPNDTFLIVNKYCQESLKALGDMDGELYFSGVHAVALYQNDQLIDIIGTIGATYENNSVVINGIEMATENNRLVRLPGQVGNSNFTESEWMVMNDCSFDDLGSHTFQSNLLVSYLVEYKQKRKEEFACGSIYQ